MKNVGHVAATSCKSTHLAVLRHHAQLGTSAFSAMHPAQVLPEAHAAAAAEAAQRALASSRHAESMVAGLDVHSPTDDALAYTTR